MNTFLTDLVTLNKVILANAERQFSGGENLNRDGLNRRSASRLRALPDNLVAAVDTEVVSGDTRYKITTGDEGTRWVMTLEFGLNKAIETMPYVVLSYTTFGDEDEMVFDSVRELPLSHYRAELTLNSLGQRDALLRALSDYNSQTTLVVAVKSQEGLLNTITDPKVFYFAENYYPYIYQGILPPPPKMQLQLLSLAFGTNWYNYYQDYVRKNYLYYLPDNFALATNPDDNDKPMISISFSAEPGATSPKQVNVTFDYFLVPIVNQQRIASASEQFKEPNGQLAPLLSASTLKLQMTLPGGRREQPDALIDLQSGIIDSFTLPSTQFGQVWDALFNTAPQSLLLKGYLEVGLEGFNPEHIPARLALDSRYKDKVRDFIHQSGPVEITKTLEFTSLPAAWDPSGPRPIQRMLVSISGQTVDLDKEHPSHSVEVKVSVLDQILNPNDKLIYHYDLQIFYVNGTRETRKDQQSTFEIIYVP